jgi:hypothetical protein
MTVSLSLLMMVAQILMTMKLWHLEVFEELLCVLCLPSLLILANFRSSWTSIAASSRSSSVPSAP